MNYKEKVTVDRYPIFQCNGCDDFPATTLRGRTKDSLINCPFCKSPLICVGEKDHRTVTKFRGWNK